MKRVRGWLPPDGAQLGDAQQCCQFFSVDEGEHVESRFAVVDGAGYGIDMGEDEIHRFLRKVIERLALGNNITEQCVVFL